MNSRHCPQKRSKKYNKLTDQERSQVMELKQDGVSCQEIAKRLKKNLKTIQSVQNSERKSEYKGLKEAVTQYGIDQLCQVTSIQTMEDRKLKKLVINTVKSVLPPKNTSMFAHLIPPQKADSNKRRIIDQIVDNILDIIQKKQISETFIDLSKPILSPSRDTILEENSNYLDPTFNDCQDYQEDQNRVYLSNRENCHFDTFSEMIQLFENSSISSSNNNQFEETIEEFSKQCFGN